MILGTMLLFVLFSTLKSQEHNSKVIVYENFKSEYVKSRNVEVWLPENYSKEKKYPVLYMHDGQNVFNPLTSYTGIDWGADETMDSLISEGKVREAIIVAAWCTDLRFNEYMPNIELSDDQKELLKQRTESALLSDSYLKFMVEELKPFIDKNYSTLPDRENTMIMGSSMGGLISFYALCQYPETFGAAGCISTHWPIADGAVIKALAEKIPSPNTHRFYFDYGTATLDSLYEPYQIQADSIFASKGYRKGVNYDSRKFEGAEHNERAWRNRLRIPLTFLFGK